MLSSETKKRLAAAQQNETTYRPNDAIAAELAGKTLVMFVGPVAVGKSFLMNHVAEADKDFSRVSVFTTREARPDDEPGMFRYLPHDDAHVSKLLDKIENGEVVQYAVHPTSGRIYGSEAADHSNKFNMLATLSGAVAQLQQLPFKDTVVLGVVARPEFWKKRLKKRYPTPNKEEAKRLREAVLSLDWLLSHEEVKWIDNSGANADDAMQSIVNIVKYNQTDNMVVAKYAREMQNCPRFIRNYD